MHIRLHNINIRNTANAMVIDYVNTSTYTVMTINTQDNYSQNQSIISSRISNENGSHAIRKELLDIVQDNLGSQYRDILETTGKL